jgi:hypothetical protein
MYRDKEFRLTVIKAQIKARRVCIAAAGIIFRIPFNQAYPLQTPKIFQ